MRLDKETFFRFSLFNSGSHLFTVTNPVATAPGTDNCFIRVAAFRSRIGRAGSTDNRERLGAGYGVHAQFLQRGLQDL